MSTFSRRQFLKTSAIAGSGAVLAACAPATKPAEAPAGESDTTAPSEGEAPSAAKGELRVDILQGPPVEVVTKLIADQFVADHPGMTVKFEYISGDRAEGAYTKAAAGTLADVIFSADLWVTAFAKGNVTLDLKPLAEADKDWDINDVYPAMLGLGTFDDQIHMLPSSLDVVTMYYNIDLFEKASAELPNENWTWDDLVTNCKKITELEKDQNGNPMYWGLSHTSNGVWNWWAAYYPWIVGYSGDILKDDKSTWSSPEVVAGLTAYTDLWLKHNIAQPLGMDLGGDSFRMGRAAIYTHIPGSRTGVRTDVGDKFNWDCQVLPKMPDGKHRTGMGAWGLSVYAGSKFKQQAFDYVKTMCTANIQLKMAKDELGTPLVKSVGDTSTWMEGLPTPPTNYAAFVKGADDAVLPVTSFPADCGSFYAGELNQSINTALEEILRGVKSVTDAMADIDATTNACLGG